MYVEGDIGLNTIPEMGLRTADISDPRDVKLHKVYRGLFAPAGVAAPGKVAFVADQSAGFRVLDLSNPAQVVEIGAVDLSETPLHVVFGGDHAYVAAREGGLRIVDISRPDDPTEVAYIDADDEIVDVAYVGETLYAAGSENGTYTVSADLKPFAAGPAQRVRAAGGGLVIAAMDEIGFFEGTGSAAQLAVQANGFATRSGLTVAAAGTDGLQPETIRTLAVPQRVYRLARTDSVLPAAGDDDLRIYRRGTWSELAYVKTPSFATAVVVQDGLAYTGDLSGMMTVVNVAKMLAHSEASPSGHSDAAANRIGIYKVADRVHGLDVSGGEFAVAAGREGVRVVHLPLLKTSGPIAE